MQPISLTARELSLWFEERGVPLKDGFWQTLRNGCEKEGIFEFPIVVDCVPWIGSARFTVSFATAAKLETLGCAPRKGLRTIPNSTTYVVGLALEARIERRRRLRRPSSRFTPLFDQSCFSVLMEQPTIADLDAAWRSVSEFAPKVSSATTDMANEFERIVGDNYHSMH